MKFNYLGAIKLAESAEFVGRRVENTVSCQNLVVNTLSAFGFEWKKRIAFILSFVIHAKTASSLAVTATAWLCGWCGVGIPCLGSWEVECLWADGASASWGLVLCLAALLKIKCFTRLYLEVIEDLKVVILPFLPVKSWPAPKKTNLAVIASRFGTWRVLHQIFRECVRF